MNGWPEPKDHLPLKTPHDKPGCKRLVPLGVKETQSTERRRNTGEGCRDDGTLAPKRWSR